MITDIIKPISLLAGSHEDTGTTGQGCFMNVIAYLNGEAQITDESPCVCVTIRKPIIWFNDFLKDNERQALIPFIERAMGSVTTDQTEMKRRVDLLVKFAQNMAAAAADAAANAANAAYAAYAAANAANAAYAAKAAYAAAKAACAANREKIKAIAFKFFDDLLPKPSTVPDVVLKRAKALAELNA